MIKPTSTLKGEKLREKEVRPIMCVGKWSLKGKVKVRGQTRFSFRAAQKMPATREKRRKLEGSREAREERLIMHGMGGGRSPAPERGS